MGKYVWTLYVYIHILSDYTLNDSAKNTENQGFLNYLPFRIRALLLSHSRCFIVSRLSTLFLP